MSTANEVSSNVMLGLCGLGVLALLGFCVLQIRECNVDLAAECTKACAGNGGVRSTTNSGSCECQGGGR